MNIDRVTDLIEAFGNVDGYVIWQHETVQHLYNNPKDFINQLITLDMLNDINIYTITFTDNLIEVILDEPQIR